MNSRESLENIKQNLIDISQQADDLGLQLLEENHVMEGADLRLLSFKLDRRVDEIQGILNRLDNPGPSLDSRALKKLLSDV